MMNLAGEEGEKKKYVGGGSFGFAEKGERLNESSGTSEVVSFRRVINLGMLGYHICKYTPSNSETPLGLAL